VFRERALQSASPINPAWRNLSPSRKVCERHPNGNALMAKRNSTASRNARTSAPPIDGSAFAFVDPVDNRESNADESMPQTLVPDIVRMNVDQRSDEATAAQRAERIAKRAYEIAEQRGFAPGAEMEDWLAAEREIDAAPVRQTPPEDQFTG
jgi:hypothetical protein